MEVKVAGDYSGRVPASVVGVAAVDGGGDADVGPVAPVIHGELKKGKRLNFIKETISHSAQLNIV